MAVWFGPFWGKSKIIFRLIGLASLLSAEPNFMARIYPKGIPQILAEIGVWYGKLEKFVIYRVFGVIAKFATQLSDHQGLFSLLVNFNDFGRFLMRRVDSLPEALVFTEGGGTEVQSLDMSPLTQSLNYCSVYDKVNLPRPK